MRSTEKMEDELRYDRPVLVMRAIFDYPRSLLATMLPPQQSLYTPLQHHDSFRLLKILPGRGGQIVKCSLEYTRLGISRHTLSYEALSYVWSHRKVEKTIICNGHDELITSNLHDALVQLRRANKERFIWCDSICLNQADGEEKGHQVQMMHQIYKQASRVIVWLGTDSDGMAPRAFSTLHAVGQNRVQSNVSEDKAELGFDYGRRESSPRVDDWLAVVTLFLNKWWTRMWVVQEIVLAERAVFMWGSTEVDWSIVQRAIDRIRMNSALSMWLDSRGLQNASIMLYLSKLCRSQPDKHQSFLHLLDLTRSFDATIPHDKIFGLLGLLSLLSRRGSDGFKTSITAHYDCDVAEAYTQVVQHHLNQEQNLDFLSFTAHTKPDFDTCLKIPSWVPNWSSEVVLYPLTSFEHQSRYTAGKGRSIDRGLLEKAGLSEGKLHLRGAVVGRIAEVQGGAPFTDLHQATPHLRTMIEWCLDRALSGMTLQTLTMTLTAGRNNDGSLVTDTTQHVVDFTGLLHALNFTNLSRRFPNEMLESTGLLCTTAQPLLAKEATWRYTSHRSAFTTSGGKLGLGPKAAKEGDYVVLLWGGQVPYVLRQMKGGWWSFVGECYVDGWMMGEVEGMTVSGEDEEVTGEEMMFELR